jgi:DNA-binding transcriptional MocR family regulator
VEVAVDEGLILIEDDVYRELTYDGPAPPSLWSAAPRGTVLRMGSFAKSLAPGLRLGWLNGSADQIRRIVESGLRDSGGGVNPYTAMTVATLCESGEYERQVARYETSYRARRDALHDALLEHLPPGCSWLKPGGGYFIWLTLAESMDAEAILSDAEAARVTWIPGAQFCVDGCSRNSLRLAFSVYPPDALAEGARRLGKVLSSGV